MRLGVDEGRSAARVIKILLLLFNYYLIMIISDKEERGVRPSKITLYYIFENKMSQNDSDDV